LFTDGTHTWYLYNVYAYCVAYGAFTKLKLCKEIENFACLKIIAINVCRPSLSHTKTFKCSNKV